MKGKPKKCKWWHWLFTTSEGESKSITTILSPDRPRLVDYWYTEHHCHVCGKRYRVDVDHDMKTWEQE